jgi:copper oxidase (laccase) domain-containing protein
MNSVIHLGAASARRQVVAEPLKAKNINLLRKAPSALPFSGGPVIVQPNYLIYRGHLAAFMSAMSGTKARGCGTHFHAARVYL